MIKREKSFFSFNHYVHYAMIKREKKFFFHLGTTFTMTWSTEKNFWFHFSATFAMPWSQEKEIDFYCTATFTTLWSWKKFFFISLWRWLSKYLHTSHYVQGRSEGTSSVAFAVLIINCQINFINCLSLIV